MYTNKLKTPSEEEYVAFFHDIRSGLSVVSSFLDLLASRKAVQNDERSRHFVERSSIQTKEIHDLIDNFETRVSQMFKS